MLKALKRGSVGPIVEQWQTFLRGQGFSVDATGLYDEATEQATLAFQTAHHIDTDGKVGNQTFGTAGALGFELLDSTEADGAYPPLPAFEPLSSTAMRQSLFGPLQFVPAPRPDNAEAIRITNGWEQGNMTRVSLPQLKAIPGGPSSGSLMFHRKAAEQLSGLWHAWEQRGLLGRIVSFDGAFNPRFIRGGAQKQILSNHAFGTAFDINASLNPLGAEPAAPSQPGCVYDLVRTAHAFGFYWGGHFSRRDGMHFEFAKDLGA